MAKLTRKQKERYINRYNWIYDDIYRVYNKPSEKKVNMYEYIVKISLEMGGQTPRVICYNNFFFTTAFKFWRNGNPILRVDTPHNIYMFDMIDLKDYEGN